MIEPLQHTQADRTSGPARPPASRAPQGDAFGALLARASARGSTAAPTQAPAPAPSPGAPWTVASSATPPADSQPSDTSPAAPTAPSDGAEETAANTDRARSAREIAESRIAEVRDKVKPPRGERWEPVPGRADYADVVSGPRNGWFVNLQDGPRQGQLFHIVRKDGRELHIYGEGDERTVIEMKARPRDPDHVRPREGEQFEAVGRHRDYRKIEGGERDGLYVNLSGNIRTGRTFTIVERDGARFHVYGTGRNKVEIEVGGRARRTEAEERPAESRETDGTAPAGGSGSTGGADPSAGAAAARR